jgi:hypothetical protein
VLLLVLVILAHPLALIVGMEDSSLVEFTEDLGGVLETAKHR